MIMKQLFLSFIFLFLASGVGAQVPGVFSFQGVAKNANGQPLAAGTSIKVRFTVRENDPVGSVALTDTHSPTVSQGGIFNLLVGNGNLVGTSIYALDWGTKKYYLQVELAADGINYSGMGTTQFVSVPYALHSSEADRWKNNDPVIQTGNFGQGGNLSYTAPGVKLIWHPRKGAFRAGEEDDNAWNDAAIGNYSFAGNRGKASGSYSTAFGDGWAYGNYTFSAGINTKASGDYSFAMGSYAEALGEASVALGSGLKAKAFGGIVLGVNNNDQDNPSGTYQGNAATDRIFQIGNGTLQSHSNALTVLRNGNVGIGNNVLAPTHILEVGGRARMRHSGSTAGIYFDNSQSNPVSFVGMFNDNGVGFYMGNNWILKAVQNAVVVEGNLEVHGTIYEYSDRRLKKYFSKLNNSFTKLTSLQGYHYYWKDTTKSQSLQTGLIAQEVEELFPELVKTDEKGMKSVNYVGLIPHLIEAIKELKKENQERLGQLEAKVNTLLKTAAQPETTQSK